MTSSKPNNSRTFSSPGFPTLSSSMPLVCSSFKYLASTPSSSKEQSIPSETCPRMEPLLIVPPGRTQPSTATITFKPLRTLGAPQTI